MQGVVWSPAARVHGFAPGSCTQLGPNIPCITGFSEQMQPRLMSHFAEDATWIAWLSPTLQPIRNPYFVLNGQPAKELALRWCPGFQIIASKLVFVDPKNCARYTDCVVCCPSAVNFHRIVSGTPGWSCTQDAAFQRF